MLWDYFIYYVQESSRLNICSFSFYRSCAKGTDATHTASPWSVRLDKWGPSALPFLLIRIYLSSAASGAIPNVPVWKPVHAAQQHHGHREHLWTGGQDALQRGGMGQEYPVLPRPSDHRPGCPSEVDLEWVVCAQCRAVLHAAPCGSTSGGGWPSRLPYVCGQSGRLYGPH